MTRLPVCSGESAIRAFERAGWIRDRQRGSHVTLTKSDSPVVLTVPLHSELGPGLLRSLIRKASLTVEEFQALLSQTILASSTTSSAPPPAPILTRSSPKPGQSQS